LALPGRLEHQSRFLAHHEAVAVVGGAVIFVDEADQPFANVQYPATDAEIRRAFRRTTPLAQSAVMLRKDAFKRTGGYREIFAPAEDADLWLRIAARHQLANVAEPVVRYRLHPAQASVQKVEMQALRSVAARAAARAPMEGRPDPFDEAVRIDEETLLAQSVSRDEITTHFVHSAVRLAKTMERAAIRAWPQTSSARRVPRLVPVPGRRRSSRTCTASAPGPTARSENVRVPGSSY